MSVDEITSRSVRAIRNHVRHLLEVSPFYRETLTDVDPMRIQSVEDIQNLPLTDKATVNRHMEKFWAVSPAQVVETVVTSGSTGRPLVFFMTESDLERLAFNEALSFYAAGVANTDRAQLIVSMDRLFIAAMAYYRGLIQLGANVFRVGVAPASMQKHYFELLKPTVIVGVPSFLRKLGAELSQSGYKCADSSIRKIIAIGESIRAHDLSLNSLGMALETLYGANVYSTYGCTELSVAYCECVERTGSHSHPELVYTEILDENGSPVPDGVPGELVATPLGVEGVPLLRYRTGDITFKIPGSCACGRNSCRIGPILARKSQMIKLKGTTLYPTTITTALDELDCLEDYVILLEGDNSLSDQVTIHAVAKPSDVIRISEHLRSKARVSFPVLVTNAVTIHSLRGDSRKKVHVIDKRRKKASAVQN